MKDRSIKCHYILLHCLSSDCIHFLVTTRVAQLRTLGESLVKKLDTTLSLELLKMPKSMKEMKVSDFLSELQCSVDVDV